MTGLIATVMIGFVALSADLSHVYQTRVALQETADSAAVAGALVCSQTACGTTTAAVSATVADVVQANGWPATVIKNAGSEYLPTSPTSASESAVQTTLTTSVSLWFAGVVTGSRTINVSVTAIANMSSAVYCIINLSSYYPMTVDNDTTLNTQNCGMAVNTLPSSGSYPLVLGNVGTLLTTSTGTLALGVASNPCINCTASVKPAKWKYSTQTPDPLSSVGTALTEAYNNCTIAGKYPNLTTTVKTNATWTLGSAPGCIGNCCNLTMYSSNETLTLGPGTWIFQNLVPNGGYLVATSGSTIVVPGSWASPQTHLAITAPTTGQYAGIALFTVGGLNFNHSPPYSTSYDITGTIYAPNGFINFDIPDTLGICTYIIGQQLTFNNPGAGSSVEYPASGCTPPWGASGSTSVTLVQ